LICARIIVTVLVALSMAVRVMRRGITSSYLDSYPARDDDG